VGREFDQDDPVVGLSFNLLALATVH